MPEDLEKSRERKGLVSLAEAAELLGVHYMTVYRYVRRGQLPSAKVEDRWQILQGDLDQFRSKQQWRKGSGAVIDASTWSQRYEHRLLAPDPRGAWEVLQRSQAEGLTTTDVYLDVITPALERIGHAWRTRRVGISPEHQATVIVRQHLGRLSVAFSHRGRRRGSIVLGCPPGEFHDLGLQMAADLFVAGGYNPLNLGANSPASAFQEAIEADDTVIALGVSSHDPNDVETTRQLVSDLRLIAPHTPIVVGGGTANESNALELGADHMTNDVETALDWLNSIKV